ncbi:hypothetical protein CANINC_003743 [Pichia inconspicua]|uniref:PPIase cyclophilin-type domain-containing protein n=1 Tax=Pichia inconspicua TaxID=52247 RepID=A0A4T0WXU1_9ASCO|nr:hypothetical protein CANINC_003743 [[Candida] inconspicua]
MPRYFLEFLNLQKDEPDSLLVTLKLFHKNLPNTTEKIAQLFEDNDLKLSYRKTLVTRIIAPEYLVQFGSPVRRSKKETNLIDFREFKNLDITFEKKLLGRTGLVCAAEKPGIPTMELCILFVPWGKYEELEGYVVIGECKEWCQLRDWLVNIDVAKQGESWEIPTGDGVWINRCGILEDPIKKAKKSNTRVDTETIVEVKRPAEGKVRAVDLLFKKRKRI